MTVNITAALRDARALWQRDRDTLLRIAGPFLFLPTFASLLLIPYVGPEPGAGQEAAQQAMLNWLGLHIHWIAVRLVIDMFGVAALLTLYLDRSHQTVGEALIRASRLFGGYLLASLLAWAIVFVGLLAFIAPGLYAVGRLTMVGPAVVAERKTEFGQAIARSIQLTRGNGWSLLGVIAAVTLAGNIATLIVLRIGEGMAAANATNPVTVAILGAAGAAVATLTTIARVLIEVAIYRRLVANSGI